MLPVILSGLLYYLLNPIVDWMEKHKINRVIAISIVFVIIALFIIWGLAVAIPNLQRQVLTFFLQEMYQSTLKMLIELLMIW